MEFGLRLIVQQRAITSCIFKWRKLELKTFPYIVNCTFKHADQQGNLIGLGYGIIYKYSIKDGSLKLYTELQPNIGIYDIKEGDDGYYWLGTSNGVYRWDGEKEF